MAASTPAASAATEHASSGLPQFDPAPWPGEIFWALVVFLVLYLLISRVFVPRVGGTIADREDRIAGDIGEARRARDAAQADLDSAAAEIAAARARSQKIALDAQAEAKARAASARAQEEARLGQILEAAEARIGAARSEAMSHVRTIAVDAAQAMVARLTGTEPGRDQVEDALAALPNA